MYDPSTFYQDQLRRLQQPFLPRAQEQPTSAFPPLSPEEEESALSMLSRKTLGGVAYIGGVLDKTFGGRAVRGLLGGKPRELLSVIPGSDTFGITDEKDITYGRDLLEKAGILSPNQEGFDAGDVAGFATDVLLDPATYFSFGGSALTKGGHLAKAANIIPKTLRGRMGTTLAEAITAAGGDAGTRAAQAAAAQGVDLAKHLDQPLGGLARLHLPFSRGGAVLGTGETGAAVLDALGGLAGGIGKYTGAKHVSDFLGLPSLGRGFKALFQSRVGDTTTPVLQEAMPVVKETGERLAAERTERLLKMMQDLRDSGELNPSGAIVKPLTSDVIRGSLEGVVSPLPGSMTADVVERLRQFGAGPLQADLPLGADWLPREFWAPRQQTLLEQGTKGLRNVKGLDWFDPSAIAREKMYGDMPTSWVNSLVGQSPDLNVRQPLEAANDIRGVLHEWENAKKLMGRKDAIPGGVSDLEQRWLDLGKEFTKPTRMDPVTGQVYGRLTGEEGRRLAELEQAAGIGPLPAAEQAEYRDLVRRFNEAREFDKLEGLRQNSQSLADWLRKDVDPRYAQLGLPFFGNNVFSDFLTRTGRGAMREAKLDTLHDVLARNAVGPGTADAVPYIDVLQEMGLSDRSRLEAMKRLEAAGKIPVGDHEAFMAQMVPGDIAADVTRTIRGFQRPEALDPLVNAIDTVTALTKFGQIGPWPSRYARDLGSQIYKMVEQGHAPPGSGPLGYWKSLKDADAIFRKGQVLADANQIPALAGMSNEEATKQIQRWYSSWGRDKIVKDMDQLGPGGMHAVQQGLVTPGDPQQTILQVLSDIPSGSLNPLNIAGVGGRRTTTFGPAVAAHKVSQSIDDVARGGSFLALLRQGYTPEAAWREAGRAHYDFGNLSSFERGFVRRVVPYYPWMRQNIPAMTIELLQNPGGLTGQLMRGVATLREGEGFTPPDVSENIGIPLGNADDGTQRFLMSLGLPFEDLQKFTGGRGLVGSGERIAERMLGETNPLLKGPLELATGKQFYSGRDLSDLYSVTGNIPAEQLIMNSPLSRFWSYGRKMADPRKDLLDKLLLTVGPGQIKDVDMEKRRGIAAREATADLLRGIPGVRSMEIPYVMGNQESLVDPETALLLRLHRTLEKQAQERAKAAKTP